VPHSGCAGIESLPLVLLRTWHNSVNFTIMLKAAAIAYGYTEEDKKIVRQMAMDDRAGLTAALEADPLLPWIAYESGLIDEVPNSADNGRA
jgi:hypothetical protein